MRFRREHIAGAQWAIRPGLAALLASMANDSRPLVLIVEEPPVAACAALELQAMGLSARLLEGGPADWRAAGLLLESSDSLPADEDCIDFLFFVHDRHDGNKEAARRYLAWEADLIGQLDAQELGTYRLPATEDHGTHR